jgi:inosine-uridine nucleoside N-ribohydrolase
MKTKVILDTDIGSDIDDAVALAYLLAQPECELLGITTVTGEATRRAMMASALCRIAGKDVPIFPGVEKPMLIPPRQTKAPQADALSLAGPRDKGTKWPHAKKFPQGQAIEFLKKTIRANPGEVVLLTIGPLTNIGLLFAEDPEIPSMLKSLVMMCGVFSNRRLGVGPCEWNARLDPHATAICYAAAPPVHRSIGLDVTTQVVMSADEVRKRFTAPLLRPVLDFAEVWFKDVKQITFHDPLAATVLFDETLVKFERGTVEVELASDKLKGFTLWTPGKPESPGRHEVPFEVDARRFFEHYFSVF